MYKDGWVGHQTTDYKIIQDQSYNHLFRILSVLVRVINFLESNQCPFNDKISGDLTKFGLVYAQQNIFQFSLNWSRLRIFFYI